MQGYLFHPIFVHFTAALLFLSPLLFLFGAIAQSKSWGQQLLRAARWDLWVGVGMTLFTVASGLYAFGTVPHNDAGHPTMLLHRNWALSTAALYLLLALWSYRHFRLGKLFSLPFLALALVASGMLGATGYLGGELVFKYGVGVEAANSGEHGDHHHGEIVEPPKPSQNKSAVPSRKKPRSHKKGTKSHGH